MNTRQIHATAVVDSRAEIEEGVEIGPYAVVGAGVSIGAGSKVWHHATVWGNTVIGKDCEIYPYASIGKRTQDLKYEGGSPGVRIGDGNTFREYVSINAATNDGDFTEIGNHNYLLAYCHVGHCCKLGNHIVASNGAAFAGHVTVEDYAGIGGGTAIHQFCHIGAHSFIGGCSKVQQDIPPYLLGDGSPARVRMYNKVGLERSGFGRAQLATVKFLFKAFYREGLNRQQAIDLVESSEFSDTPEARAYLAFVESSERGVAAGSK